MSKGYTTGVGLRLFFLLLLRPFQHLVEFTLAGAGHFQKAGNYPSNLLRAALYTRFLSRLPTAINRHNQLIIKYLIDKTIPDQYPPQFRVVLPVPGQFR